MDNMNQISGEQRQSLQIQYQVLHQDSRSIVTIHWTVVSIFFGINTALLSAIAYILKNSANDSVTRWIVLSLGIALNAIFVCLWIWLDRVNKNVEINEDIMRNIEGDLKIRVKTKLKGSGSWSIKGIYVVFMLLWIYFMVAAFLPCI